LYCNTAAGLTTDRVLAEVGKLRKKKVRFRDTVPQQVPPLSSPCNF
jgi:hypothetical protein